MSKLWTVLWTVFLIVTFLWIPALLIALMRAPPPPAPESVMTPTLREASRRRTGWSELPVRVEGATVLESLDLSKAKGFLPEGTDPLDIEACPDHQDGFVAKTLSGRVVARCVDCERL